jgi:hypothetical protein
MGRMVERRGARLLSGSLAAGLLAAGVVVAPGAGAALTDVIDCTAEVGDPVPGSIAWDVADTNNRWCASEGARVAAANPAFDAALAANGPIVDPDDPLATVTDPFRATVRWGATRGDHQAVTWTDPSGVARPGALFGPRGGGSGRGAIVVRHPTGAQAPYLWASEVLAEHGYIVFSPEVDGDVEITKLATSWFLSDANPWADRLEDGPLGIAGHSAAGSIAGNVGNSDDRFGAVVVWDSSGAPTVPPSTPTLFELGEYGMATSGVTFYEPHHTRPVPTGKWTRFDDFRAAGVDTMQVALRSSTHGEWSNPIHPLQVAGTGGSLHGEAVSAYYLLLWFDYHLRGSKDALDLLTDTSTFDEFSDGYASGTGHFDAAKARAAGNVEAGNVPITVGGHPIRMHLSWQYPSRYSLDKGKEACADMRGGC